MEAMAVLRKDRTALKHKLFLLERLLPLPHETVAPLQQLTDDIARYLRCVSDQETYLLTALNPSGDQGRQWRIRRLLTSQRRTIATLLQQITHAVESCSMTEEDRHLLDRLRTELEQEEEVLLSWLEDALDRSYEQEIAERLLEISGHRHDAPGPAIPSVREL